MDTNNGKKDLTTPETTHPATPFGDRFHRLREEFDRFAHDMFGGNWLGGGALTTPSDFMPGFGAGGPKIDVHENDKTLTVTAELPGIDEKDVELTVKNGVLTLKGEKRYERKDDKDEARVIERRYGSFQRCFTLPDTVDDEKADAKFDKGVLTITLPKRPGSEKPERRIGITKV